MTAGTPRPAASAGRTRLWVNGKLKAEDFPLDDVSGLLDDEGALVWVDLLNPDRALLDELAVQGFSDGPVSVAGPAALTSRAETLLARVPLDPDRLDNALAKLWIHGGARIDAEENVASTGNLESMFQ